jgi:hypothetical protein
MSEKSSFGDRAQSISAFLSCYRNAETFRTSILDNTTCPLHQLYLIRTTGERCGLAKRKGEITLAARRGLKEARSKDASR